MINKQLFCNAFLSIAFGSSKILLAVLLFQKPCSPNQRRALQNSLMRLATGSRKNCPKYIRCPITIHIDLCYYVLQTLFNFKKCKKKPEF